MIKKKVPDEEKMDIPMFFGRTTLYHTALHQIILLQYDGIACTAEGTTSFPGSFISPKERGGVREMKEPGNESL